MIILYFPPSSNGAFIKDIYKKVEWYRFYWVDYQIWAPGNFFFNYSKLPKYHFRGDFLQDSGVLEKIKDKESEKITDRTITYEKEFKNSVIITTPNDQSCLWVLDKNRKELPSYANKLLKSGLPYSDNSELAINGPASIPPKTMFGEEPSHTWCYFFEKASLARQQQDWKKLSQLTQEVIQKKLKPNDPNEWLPFIEGLLVSRDYPKAESLIRTALQNTNSEILKINICSMVERLQTKGIEIYCHR